MFRQYIICLSLNCDRKGSVVRPNERPRGLQTVRFANLGPAGVEIAGVAREQHPSVDPGGGEDDRVRQPQLPLQAQQHRLLRDADVDLENMEPGEKTPDTYDS